MAGLGRPHGASLAGLLFLLGTGVAFSWYTVASKSFLGMCSPIELTAVISVAGAIWALAPMLAEIALGNGFDGTGPQSWLMVLYLGIGNSVIAYALWNRALRGLPAAAVGASLYAQPILGAGLSWLLLRDALPATFVPGAVLVLAGVYVASSATDAGAREACRRKDHASDYLGEGRAPKHERRGSPAAESSPPSSRRTALAPPK